MKHVDMTHVPKKLDPRVLSLIPTLITMEMSLPTQKMMLDCINEMIDEIRADIISGGKTPDETNALLDELQRLTIKKQSIESRIATIRSMDKVRDRLIEKKVREALNNSSNDSLNEVSIEES